MARRGKKRPSRRSDGPPKPPKVDEALPTRRGWLTARLKRGRSTPVLAGHPWVFSGAIGAVALHPGEELIAGMPCLIVDDAGRWLGIGHYTEGARVPLRVLAPVGAEALPGDPPQLGRVVSTRLDQALALRERLGLPADAKGQATSAFRLVHGEGDGLPGLAIDRLGDGAVVRFGTAGAFGWREGVRRWLRERAGAAWIVERVAATAHDSEGLERGYLKIHGDVPTDDAAGGVLIAEHGLTFACDPLSDGGATYSADQRDNHRRLEAFSAGRFVVDAFAGQGGFALHAARAGAKRVVAVDMSMTAVEAAIRASERNGLDHLVQVQQLDAVHALQAWADLPSGSRADRPDVVVLDPPPFAARASRVEDGLRKYTHLNQLAMRAVADGGVLVSCSSSGRVGREDFLRMLALAALRAGKEVSVLSAHGAAADHPTAAGHPEGRSLDVAFCRVRGRIDHGGS